MNVIAVNGCCYGKDRKPDKGDYFKYCGQKFWYFISGNTDINVEIIEPLGYWAKEKNDKFIEVYSNMLNKFTAEFISRFCKSNGKINWEELVHFNSGSDKLQS